MELLEDLPRTAVTFVGIAANEVAVELVEGSLGEEVGTVGEGFDCQELVFGETVDGFDIALAGVSGRALLSQGVGGRGDALVLGAEEGDRPWEAIAGAIGLQLANELATMVGLPGQVFQIDAAALEMGLHAPGKPFTVALGASLRKG